MEYLLLKNKLFDSRNERQALEDDLKERKCFEAALELGKKYLSNIAETGYKTWYEWSLANWGTKWNAGSQERIDAETVRFETAWTCVTGLLEKLSQMFPAVIFDYSYADEDTGSNCGKGTIANGVATMYLPESGSREAYELAFSIDPFRREQYKLVNGTYEYIDE